MGTSIFDLSLLMTTAFWVSLGAIILLDIVLAGDNAVVIALAARNLPPNLQKKAIIWGTAGAIIVRSIMTLIAAYLLTIPGLRLVGGLALIWIAYKLLADDGGDEHTSAENMTFAAAIKTIVIADTVMGIDNVLAVAGAANGNFLLVVLGLLISIPIMVLGSRLVLAIMNKYSFVVYLGAGVLLYTALHMVYADLFLGSINSETKEVATQALMSHVSLPLVEWFVAHSWFYYAFSAVFIIAFLGIAWMRNNKTNQVEQN